METVCPARQRVSEVMASAMSSENIISTGREGWLFGSRTKKEHCARRRLCCRGRRGFNKWRMDPIARQKGPCALYKRRIILCRVCLVEWQQRLEAS